MLLDVRDEQTGEGLSDTELRNETITFLLAGHETTANALSWTSDEHQVEFCRHRVQEQNSIALADANAPELTGDPGRRHIQFAKTVSTVAIPIDIDDGRAVSHFRNALQQDLGDIHLAKSLFRANRGLGRRK
jgi:hypothetical protein